jgi:hypothetical protein
MATSSSGMPEGGEGVRVTDAGALDASGVFGSAVWPGAANKERSALSRIATDVSGGDCNSGHLCQNTVPIFPCISQSKHFLNRDIQRGMIESSRLKTYMTIAPNIRKRANQTRQSRWSFLRLECL